MYEITAKKFANKKGSLMQFVAVYLTLNAAVLQVASSKALIRDH